MATIQVNKNYSIIVKITVNDDGEKVRNPKWHYAFNTGSGDQALCTGEYYGFGESGCEYKLSRGKITCPDCVAIIKEIKKIKL